MASQATGQNKAKDKSYTQTLWANQEPKETSPKQYEFKPCNLNFIKNFMETNHYSRSANVAAMFCFALISKRDGIVGAAIYSKPAMNSIYKLYADKEEDVVELRRLVCIDDTPKNTESYFVGKTLRWLVLNTDKKTVVTYADPSFGHVGHAYRACNMKYDGKSGTTVVLEIPVEKCVHEGRTCLGEGKTICQVHDRNMRSKVKGSDAYTPAALKLREMYNQGIAKLVPRDTKHRYHYHLEQHRSGKPQSCRQCVEGKTLDNLATNKISKTDDKPIQKRKGLNSVVKTPTKIEIQESYDTYIPSGYIQEEKIKPPITKDTIAERMEQAWAPETSYWPDKWNKENPACGQCAVTALIVQEHLGGDLLRCEVEGFGSHYFNKLADGTIIDLTKKQFPSNAKMTEAKIKKRKDIMQYKTIVKRYELLKKRFEK